MFKPLADRVLAIRFDTEEETKGGIILPNHSQEKPTKARVVAIGPGSVTENGILVPLTVKVDDIIIFTKWGGTEITEDDQDYLILKESDILATVED